MRRDVSIQVAFAVGLALGVVVVGCKGRFSLPPDARFARQIAVSSSFACGRMKDGNVRCWGANDSGQLGDGTRAARNETVAAALASNVASIAAGGAHACALGTDGGVVCWGSGESGAVPVSDGRAIAVGARHACAIVGGGAVHCWGADDAGQVAGAVRVRGAVAIEAGGDATCVIDAEHRVACWGRVPGRATPDVSLARVEGLADVTAIALGETHACAVRAWGGVACWGRNSEGELGDGSFDDRSLPVEVAGLDGGAKRVAVGRQHSCVLLGNGTVECWGANAASQLADGTRVHRAKPALVQGEFDVLDISAGGDASCVLFGDGSARCWGGLSVPKTDALPVTVPMEVRW
jgi:alpha-tubulin suppressor-like RCC1 family protein